ncbi:MAG: hypothetical protein KI791_18330 [Cyclobacteriaceae bacterium]|nr:hypothetical protein [Cyclobacteriaceae bacterium SS2]
MKYSIIYSFLILSLIANGQPIVQVSEQLNSKARVSIIDNRFEVEWDAGDQTIAIIEFDLAQEASLIRSFQLRKDGITKTVARSLDPAFILTVGKRNLERNGWTVFFDKVHERDYFSRQMTLDKSHVAVSSSGSRTFIRISDVSFDEFKGHLEITLYNGSPLLNIAAVVSTDTDGRAIIYDAGLISSAEKWSAISWMETDGQLRTSGPLQTGSKNLEVKHRAILGSQQTGNIAVFPPPHQYFYPLDEAFNLEFVWHGQYYRDFYPGYGIGIRHEPKGDLRYVPWFNSPPGTKQRLNFFVLISEEEAPKTIENVKDYTRGDEYKPLPGYKTFSSHFHNEFIMKVVLAGKPIPPNPEFVDVFKSMGVDIVHLGEFHYTAHPKGPDSLRLKELKTLFEECERLSDEEFLLLPGEEPNVHLGGHWMQIFPKPVYWVMDRNDDIPFVQNDPTYGKVYHIGSSEEMLKLLELENGLAWTAHPRIKGSIGYPDKYNTEEFYLSDRFLGGAWKPMPADLSYDRLGIRVLDLLDDMNNWGQPKRVIAEADLFTVTQENEMWANMNTNYLMLDEIPGFSDGWNEVLTALEKGKFFSTTGEVLIPEFLVNGSRLGEEITLRKNGQADIQFEVDWTFPLQYAEIISGDGNKVYRDRITLDDTTPFGQQVFKKSVNLKGRKWVRLEVWDSAVNGAFTQAIPIK